MKAKIFPSIVFFLVITMVCGQVTQSTSDVRAMAKECGEFNMLLTKSGQSIHNLMYADVRNSGTTPTISLKNVKGSPYLAENFEKADVYYGNELLGTLYARYNAYSGEMEVKKSMLEEEQYKALTKNEKIKVVFADKEILYAGFIDDKGVRQKDYLISLTQGTRYKLYQRYKVSFVEGKKAENSMVNDIPSRFTAYTDYYLKDSNTSLVTQLPSKKSKFMALFNGGDRIQIAGLLKEQSLSLKKEQDLVKLFELADGIVTEGYVAKE